MKPGTIDLTILGVCFIALQILWIKISFKNGETEINQIKLKTEAMRERLEKIFNL